MNLSVWNVNTNDWEFIGVCREIDVDPATHSGCAFTYSITSDITNYIDENDNNVVYFLALERNGFSPAAVSSLIKTDYVYLDVTTGVSPNPQTSTETLENGESFNVSWTINATGDNDTHYLVDVKFNSSYGNSNVPDNDTEDRKICIGNCPPSEPSVDTDAPTYSDFKDNSTASSPTNSTDVQLNTTITDATEIDFYRISTNNTDGNTMTNQTLLSGGSSPITVIFNESLAWFPQNVDSIMGWQIWSNDTLGFSSVSAMQTLTVQAVITDSCTPIANTNWIIEDNCTKSAFSWNMSNHYVNIKDGSLVLKDLSNLTAKFINISHNKYTAFNLSSNSRYNRTGNP